MPAGNVAHSSCVRDLCQVMVSASVLPQHVHITKNNNKCLGNFAQAIVSPDNEKHAPPTQVQNDAG
jgi:hypothetical protein